MSFEISRSFSKSESVLGTAGLKKGVISVGMKISNYMYSALAGACTSRIRGKNDKVNIAEHKTG